VFKQTKKCHVIKFQETERRSSNYAIPSSELQTVTVNSIIVRKDAYAWHFRIYDLRARNTQVPRIHRRDEHLGARARRRRYYGAVISRLVTKKLLRKKRAFDSSLSFSVSSLLSSRSHSERCLLRKGTKGVSRSRHTSPRLPRSPLIVRRERERKKLWGREAREGERERTHDELPKRRKRLHRSPTRDYPF